MKVTESISMKTIVCDRPFALEVTQRERPVRAPGEALVQIKRVGLCGTDFHIFSGNQPFLSYPRVMGHELAGYVVEADDGASIKPHGVVTINPYLPCGGCIACRGNKPNCCVNIKVLGVHIDGGMTEYISVPEAAIVPAEGLTLEQAAMVEFLAIGLHAVRRGAIKPAESVLVVGAGPIGVAVAIFAGLAGAKVSLIDTSLERLTYARDVVGIAQIAVVDDQVTAWLEAQTQGDYFDAVFDATGSAAAIETGFSYVAHGGRYVLVSVVKDMIRFKDTEFHKREMQLIGSRNATRDDFQRVIELMRAGDIPTDALQTHAFELAEAATVIPALKEQLSTVLKAIGAF